MHNVTLIPGDGTGPEIAEATRKCVEATGVKIDWDVQECGIEVIEAEGKVPDSRPRVDPREQGRPQGADHHADRQGVPQRQRLPAAGTEPVRLRAALQELQGGAVVLLRTRTSIWSSSARTPKTCTPASSSRPGEEKTAQLIRQHQRKSPPARRSAPASTRPASASSRCRIEGTRQHRQLRLRLRRQERPQVGDVGLQGEHHEVHRRPVVRRDPRRRHSPTGRSSK